MFVLKNLTPIFHNSFCRCKKNINCVVHTYKHIIFIYKLKFSPHNMYFVPSRKGVTTQEKTNLQFPLLKTKIG